MQLMQARGTHRGGLASTVDTHDQHNSRLAAQRHLRVAATLVDHFHDGGL